MKLFYYLTFSLVFLSAQAQVVINEVYVLNEGQKTSQEFFIEFYNTSKNKVDLSGYKLCSFDSNGVQTSCNFLSAYQSKSFIIDPYDFNYSKINRTPKNDYFLYCQMENNQLSLIKLFDKEGELIDAIELKALRNGKSYGRYPDGANNWAIAYISKNKKNRPHITKPESYFFDSEHFLALEKIETSSSNKKQSYLQGKVKINEIFYVKINENEFLNKDLWIELVNISNETLHIDSLGLSNDSTFKDLKLFSDSSFYNPIKDILIPGEIWYIKLFGLTKTLLEETSVDFQYNSSSFYLFDKGVLIDSVKVPILDRDESFARIPNGVGQFKVVKYETPSFSNDQVMPGENSRPKDQFIHTIGMSLSNYKAIGFDYKSLPKLGTNIGFAYQHVLGSFELRHSLNYKRQSFGLRRDSVLVTNFGKITTTTTGSQRLEYLGWSTEIGLHVNEKFMLFYGMDMDLRIGNSVNLETYQYAKPNDGEETISRINTQDNILETDVVDFNLSAALEYKIIDNLKINFSVRRDFGGVNAEANNSSGRTIKTTVYQCKLIVPFYLSDQLAHKVYFLNRKN